MHFLSTFGMLPWRSKHAVRGKCVCCVKLLRGCGSDMGSFVLQFGGGFAFLILVSGSVLLF